MEHPAVKTSFPALCLGLAACGASCVVVAHSTLALAAGTPASAAAPASGAVRATRVASAACASPGASVPRRGPAVTSKVRHVPDESDPCADSHGVAPPLPR